MILGGSLGRKGARPYHVCPQGVALSELRATLQSLRSAARRLAGEREMRHHERQPRPGLPSQQELSLWGQDEAETKRCLGQSM